MYPYIYIGMEQVYIKCSPNVFRRRKHNKNKMMTNNSLNDFSYIQLYKYTTSFITQSARTTRRWYTVFGSFFKRVFNLQFNIYYIFPIVVRIIAVTMNSNTRLYMARLFLKHYTPYIVPIYCTRVFSHVRSFYR